MRLATAFFAPPRPQDRNTFKQSLLREGKKRAGALAAGVGLMEAEIIGLAAMGALVWGVVRKVAEERETVVDYERQPH